MLALTSEYGTESARLAADERILRTKAQGVGCRLRADRKDAVKTKRASKPNSKQFSPERRDICEGPMRSCCMCGGKKSPFDFLKYCYEPIYLPPQTIENQMSWLLQLLRPEFVPLGSFSKRFNLTWHHVRRPTWRHINTREVNRTMLIAQRLKGLCQKESYGNMEF